MKLSKRSLAAVLSMAFMVSAGLASTIPNSLK